MIQFLAILVMTMILFPQPANPGAADPCLRGLFHGITRTNELGEIIGPLDQRDWGCLGDKSSPGDSPRIASPDGVPVPVPTAVCLTEAYPNPATTMSKLRFTLPQATSLTLVIYGQPHRNPSDATTVRTLADGAYAAGSFEFAWDLKDDHGLRVPAGIYRAVLTVNGSSLCGDIEIL